MPIILVLPMWWDSHQRDFCQHPITMKLCMYGQIKPKLKSYLHNSDTNSYKHILLSFWLEFSIVDWKYVRRAKLILSRKWRTILVPLETSKMLKGGSLHPLSSSNMPPITPPVRGDCCGITQTVGSEVSKLSHAWILRYKTCLYALVEDFMVAGGMWRKMIASRHRPWSEWAGRRTPSKSGGRQESSGGGGRLGSFAELFSDFTLNLKRGRGWISQREDVQQYSTISDKYPLAMDSSKECQSRCGTSNITSWHLPQEATDVILL